MGSLWKRAPDPLAVLESPVVFSLSAEWPKAVLLKPPKAVWSTLASVAVPPAVLPFASLAVGFGGPLQLGVVVSSRTSQVSIAAKRASGFMESSMRR